MNEANWCLAWTCNHSIGVFLNGEPPVFVSTKGFLYWMASCLSNPRGARAVRAVGKGPVLVQYLSPFPPRLLSPPPAHKQKIQTNRKKQETRSVSAGSPPMGDFNLAFRTPGFIQAVQEAEKSIDIGQGPGPNGARLVGSVGSAGLGWGVGSCFTTGHQKMLRAVYCRRCSHMIAQGFRPTRPGLETCSLEHWHARRSPGGQLLHELPALHMKGGCPKNRHPMLHRRLVLQLVLRCPVGCFLCSICVWKRIPLNKASESSCWVSWWFSFGSVSIGHEDTRHVCVSAFSHVYSQASREAMPPPTAN